MSYSTKKLIILCSAVKTFYPFMHIMIASNKLEALEVEVAFFVFKKSYYYNSDWGVITNRP